MCGTSELVNSDVRLTKRVAKPEFDRFKVLNEDLAGAHCSVRKLVLKKLINVGRNILDLSKTLMYDFHYSCMGRKYTKANLLFTDTDIPCCVP